MRTFPMVVGVAAWLQVGCAPLLGQGRDPGYVERGPGAMLLPAVAVYQDSVGPLSYRSVPVGSGSPREVHGEACQSAITLPVGLVWAAIESGNPALAPAFLGAGFGAGGYAEAVAAAIQPAPNTRLVNVRADLRTRIILGVWRQQCVRITASAVSADAPVPPAP